MKRPMLNPQEASAGNPQEVSAPTFLSRPRFSRRLSVWFGFPERERDEIVASDERMNGRGWESDDVGVARVFGP